MSRNSYYPTESELAESHERERRLEIAEEQEPSWMHRQRPVRRPRRHWRSRI
jgi:hypothetical protein